MKNTFARLFFVALIGATTSLTAYAEDYRCKNAGGCVATIVEDGVLQQTVFRKGDLISTEAGWVVNPDDGWNKVRSKRQKKIDV